MEIIGLGSVAMDIMMQVNALPREDDFAMIEKTTYVPGGSCANVTVQCARLGAETGFIGAISDDKLGQDIVSEFVKEGVDHSGMKIQPGGTTIHTDIVVDREGKKFIMVDAGDVFYTLQPGDVSKDYIKSAKVLYTDLFPVSVCVDLLAEAKAAGVTTVFNMQAGLPTYEGMGGDRETVLKALKHVDIFAPCQNGLYDLAGTQDLDACRDFIRQYFDGLLLVTLGRKGSVAWDKAGNRAEAPMVPHEPTQAVDTTGAGDSYIGSFMVQYCLRGMQLADAMHFASACAGYTCATLGARSSPNREQAIAYCKENGVPYEP